jgi:hypothetical protein
LRGVPKRRQTPTPKPARKEPPPLEAIAGTCAPETGRATSSITAHHRTPTRRQALRVMLAYPCPKIPSCRTPRVRRH